MEGKLGEGESRSALRIGGLGKRNQFAAHRGTAFGIRRYGELAIAIEVYI